MLIKFLLTFAQLPNANNGDVYMYIYICEFVAHMQTSQVVSLNSELSTIIASSETHSALNAISCCMRSASASNQHPRVLPTTIDSFFASTRATVYLLRTDVCVYTEQICRLPSSSTKYLLGNIPRAVRLERSPSQWFKITITIFRN